MLAGAFATGRGTTLTVWGTDPTQPLPLKAHWVFTLKLAGFTCRPVTVYVMTTCCDAVAGQLCGVSVSGVVLEPPRLAVAVATSDSDGRARRGASAGAAAPCVITISSRSGASEMAVGPSPLQAARNVRAAGATHLFTSHISASAAWGE